MSFNRRNIAWRFEKVVPAFDRGIYLMGSGTTILGTVLTDSAHDASNLTLNRRYGVSSHDEEEGKVDSNCDVVVPQPHSWGRSRGLLHKRFRQPHLNFMFSISAGT